MGSVLTGDPRFDNYFCADPSYSIEGGKEVVRGGEGREVGREGGNEGGREGRK